MTMLGTMDYTATTDEALDFLIRYRRKQLRRQDPAVSWHKLEQKRHEVGLIPVVGVDLWPGSDSHMSLAEIDARFEAGERVLRELEAEGLIQADWHEPFMAHCSPDVPFLWFIGEAIDRMGPDPRKRRRGERQSIPSEIRYVVLDRDDYECVLCGATDDLTLDHILPVIAGGSNDPINLRVLCRSCNSNKGTSLPDSIRLLGKRPPDA